jgi:hypothetical protein
MTQSYTRDIPFTGVFPGGYLAGESYDWTGAATLYIAIHSGEVYQVVS